MQENKDKSNANKNDDKIIIKEKEKPSDLIISTYNLDGEHNPPTTITLTITYPTKRVVKLLEFLMVNYDLNKKTMAKLNSLKEVF